MAPDGSNVDNFGNSASRYATTAMMAAYNDDNKADGAGTLK
jgi:hypothetical protein